MTRSFLRSLLPLAGILIAVGGCAESSVSPTAAAEWTFLRRGAQPSLSVEGTTSQGSQTIGPAGGVITAGGHSIAFPAGAVAQPTEITMTVDGTYVGVELQPHGLTFPAGRQPVLTLDLSGADVAGAGSLAVAYTGTGNEILQVLPASTGGAALRTELQHFSRYIAVAGN